MSFLHNASAEALRTELDLWAIPPTQTVLEGGQWTPYKPITSIDQSNTVEFCVPGTGHEYIDPAHTLLQIRGKIVDPQDLDFVSDDKNEATPINYLLHSLWITSNHSWRMTHRPRTLTCQCECGTKTQQGIWMSSNHKTIRD
ncbi:Acyl-CoA ligase AFT1-1 [Frankliniella fusca]|uniref:Acyl-CoA ligase AFT1-1 n=1 Tax=Frankliniella fusca TaxID=407009 RepID=A0AAE1LCZ2_9NEOP|nr:Acyl-CoA ligase AFT1-1 [Frankliniella fusca]